MKNCKNELVDNFLVHDEQLRVLPTIHHRLAFSQALQRGLAQGEWKPDVVALELPRSIENAVVKGLSQIATGPIYVGKRVRESAEVVSLDDLSLFRHTKDVLDATRGILLEARKYACEKKGLEPSCGRQRWLSTDVEDFEPFLIAFERTNFGRPYCNIVLPERRHQGSAGFAVSRERIGNTWKTERLGARVWYTPLFHADERWKRHEWIREDHEEKVPAAKTNVINSRGGQWLEQLGMSALNYCTTSLLYLSPDELPPPEALLQAAEAKGVQVVHVPLSVLNAEALEIVRHDEHEVSLFDHPDVREKELEAFALYSGDAYVAGIEYALANKLQIAWIDREMRDTDELRLASSRPSPGSSLTFIEDSHLLDEGISSFYERTKTIVEKTRVESVDQKREEHMAREIQTLKMSGKRILFICGAAHWGNIARLLTEEYLSEAPEPTDPELSQEPGELFCSGSFSMICGADELPSTMLKYRMWCSKGRALDFSPLRANGDTEERMLSRLRKMGNLPPGDVLNFKAYLNRLCVVTGVVVPRLFHFLEAARTCLDEGSDRVILQECMRFFQCPNGVPKASKAVTENGNTKVSLGGDTLTVRSRWGESDYLYDQTAGRLKVPEGETDVSGGGRSMTSHEWDLLYRDMMLKARRLSKQKIRTQNPFPLTGLLRGPIDVRATIRARGVGDRRIRQRIEIPVPFNSRNEFEGFDPVVFEFFPEHEGSPKFIHLGPDIEFASGMTFDSRSSDLSLPRQRNFSLLVAWIPIFGESDPAIYGRVKRWLLQGNYQYVPRRSDAKKIFENKRWLDETAMEGILSIAREYSRESVFLVGHRPPSRRIIEEYQRAGKRIHFLSISRFNNEELQALRSPVMQDFTL